jgi:hypothetical protein
MPTDFDLVNHRAFVGPNRSLKELPIITVC